MGAVTWDDPQPSENRGLFHWWRVKRCRYSRAFRVLPTVAAPESASSWRNPCRGHLSPSAVPLEECSPATPVSLGSGYSCATPFRAWSADLAFGEAKNPLPTSNLLQHRSPKLERLSEKKSLVFRNPRTGPDQNIRDFAVPFANNHQGRLHGHTAGRDSGS